MASAERPTRHRLQLALGLAACIVSILLVLAGLLLDYASKVATARIDYGDSLSVRIRHLAPQAAPADESNPQTIQSAPVEQPPPNDEDIRQEQLVSGDRLVETSEPKSAIDWQALTTATVTTNVDDYFRSEQNRAAMLRSSHSLMFQREDDFATRQDEPLLADLRFRPQLHVFGLGLTFGSCFIGIPLAGVPVEQRNVAITLFVCAREPS